CLFPFRVITGAGVDAERRNRTKAWPSTSASCSSETLASNWVTSRSLISRRGRRLLAGTRQLVAPRTPSVPPSAREELNAATFGRRAEPLDKIVEGVGLLRVRARRCLQHCALIRERQHRLPTRGHQAVLAPAAEPVAQPHPRLHPRETRLVGEAPRVDDIERVAQMRVRRPEPQHGVLVCARRDG